MSKIQHYTNYYLVDKHISTQRIYVLACVLEKFTIET